MLTRRALVAGSLVAGSGVRAQPVSVFAEGPVFHAVTVWNAADKSATVTLSNANLTAVTGSAGAVRTTGNSFSTGKVYFELTMTASTADISFGLANAAETLASAQQLGSTANSLGCYPTTNSDVFVGNAKLFGPNANGGLGVNAFAFDLGSKLLWWSNPAMRTAGTPWNFSASANPATGVGGISFSGLNAGPYMIAFGDDAAGGNVTLNAGQGPFAVGVPSGFVQWG